MWDRVRGTSGKRHIYEDVTVCDRWKEFANFLADMGPRPADHSIDRIRNEVGYEPANCRWATTTTQNRNRKTTRLDQLKAREIRSLIATGHALRAIARQYGLNLKTVQQVRDFQIWREM